MDIASPLFDPRFLEQYRALMEPTQEAKRAAGMDSLLALGLGLLANRGPHLGPAIGNAGFAAMGTYRAGLDSARQNRMGEIQGAMGLRKLQQEMEADDALNKHSENYIAGLPPEKQDVARLAFKANRTEFGKMLTGQFGPQKYNAPTQVATPQGPRLAFPSESGEFKITDQVPFREQPAPKDEYKYNPLTNTWDFDPIAYSRDLSKRAAGAARQTVNLPKMTDDTRKEFMGTPAFKNWETVQRVALAARSAAKRNDKASDYDLITAVAKVVDPESVVRESEFTAWGSAQSPQERLQALAQYLSGGGVLTPSGRQKLLSVVENRAAATKKIYDATKKGYEKIAGARGLPPEELFFPDIEQDDDETERGKLRFQQYLDKGR